METWVRWRRLLLVLIVGVSALGIYWGSRSSERRHVPTPVPRKMTPVGVFEPLEPHVSPEKTLSAEACEILDRRDAHAKHYANPDGSTTALISAAPIHYRDENGRWEEIQLGFESTEDGVENRANLLRSRFSRRSSGSSRIGPDPRSYYIWEPKALAYARSDGSTVEWARPQRVDARTKGAEIRYEGVFPGGTERYELRPGMIKHDLLLHVPPPLPSEASTFDYVGRIELSDSLAFFVEGNAVASDFATDREIAIGRPGEPSLMVLDRVVAVDAAGERTLGRYDVRAVGDGGFLMRLQVPAAWLLEPKRAYPVAIDPTTWSRSLTARSDGTCWKSGILGGGHHWAWGHYDGSVWLRDEPALTHLDPVLIGQDYDYFNEYYRGAVEWNIRSIPVSSEFRSAEVRFRVRSKNYGEFDSDTVRVGLWSLEKRPEEVGDDAGELHGDCADGTKFASVRLTRGEGATSWVSLGDQVDSALYHRVEDAWFGIGLSPEEGGDRGVLVDLDLTILKVVYDMPPTRLTLQVPHSDSRVARNQPVPFRWTGGADADEELWGEMIPTDLDGDALLHGGVFPDGNRVEFRLYCDTRSYPNSLIYSGTRASYSWTGELEPGTYYWRVEAVNGAAMRDSEIRSFRVNAPPAIPTPIAPWNGWTLPAGSVMVGWLLSSDPEHDPVRYQWRVDTTNPFKGPWVAGGWSEDGGRWSRVFETAKQTTYYWSVRAFDGRDYSSWSPVWSFRTE